MSSADGTVQAVKSKSECLSSRNKTRDKTNMMHQRPVGKAQRIHPKGAATSLKKPESFMCELCGQTFGQLYYLTAHRSVSHRCDMPNTLCLTCSKEFPTRITWWRHLLYHHKYACYICRQTFKLRYDLQKHIVAHTLSKCYVCRRCRKSFRLRSQLDFHLTKHSIQCVRSCSEKQVHHQQLKFRCSSCRKIFPDKEQLLLHTQVQSCEKITQNIDCDNQPQLYSCGICSRMFRRKGDLKVHVLNHAGNKRHVCEHCDKRFFKRNDLARHLRVHDNKRPCVCEICGKSYKLLTHLVLHRKVHHEMTEYGCDTCQKSFRSHHGLVNHRRVHRGMQHSCETCGRQFNRLFNLRAHYKTHRSRISTAQHPDVSTNNSSAVFCVF